MFLNHDDIVNSILLDVFEGDVFRIDLIGTVSYPSELMKTKN